MSFGALFLTLFALAAVYGLGLLLAWRFQERLLYFPDRERIAPAAKGLADVTETPLPTPDGETVITWRAPAAGPDRPVILYLHGNARNLAHRAGYFWLFLSKGWGLAALSYRSFGGSTGRPTEARNLADATQLFDQLVADGVDPARIVIYGESLGSGLATMLAARRTPAALVVHAPYDAVEEVAAWRAPFALPRLILTDRYRSIDAMPAVRCPVLWLHGDRDGVIPIRFGHNLFAAATAPKQAAVVKGAGHFDLYAPNVFDAHVAPFVESLSKAENSTASTTAITDARNVPEAA